MLFAVALPGCAAAGTGAARAESAGEASPPSLAGIHSIASPGPRTVRASVVVSFERGGERQQVEAYLEAIRPDRMRLRAHIGFIQAFELTSRSDSFWVSIPHYGALIEGRKSEVRLAPLDPARMAQALFLRVCEQDTLKDLAAERDSSGDWWRTRADSGGWQRLEVDPLNRPLRFQGFRSSGEACLEIEWSRYAVVEGGSYPKRIRWSDPVLHQSLTFDFDDIRLDADLEDNRFEPKPRADWKVIPWTSWQEIFEP